MKKVRFEPFRSDCFPLYIDLLHEPTIDLLSIDHDHILVERSWVLEGDDAGLTAVVLHHLGVQQPHTDAVEVSGAGAGAAAVGS